MEQKNTLMGVLAYLGPLVIVSYAMAKDDPFVKFHIKQGLVLLVIEIIAGLLASVMWQFFFILQLINLGTLILAIIGILNVTQGTEKELPVVGQFASKFTF